jgi:membrane protein implicated in regulation of membrane protease activity
MIQYEWLLFFGLILALAIADLVATRRAMRRAMRRSRESDAREHHGPDPRD